MEEHNGDDEDDDNNSSQLQRKTLLQMVFLFLGYQDFAHTLPLVSKKWYQVSYYSESLWEPFLNSIITNTSKATSESEGKGAKKRVFQQQEKSPILAEDCLNGTKQLPQSSFDFLTTTTLLRRQRGHQRISTYRQDFIMAYRRHILCERFFQEMGFEKIPAIDPRAAASLQKFQRKSNICLPATLMNLLQRSKIHRYIPHLWNANLTLQKLQYIPLSSNRILLEFLKDSQDCWCGFVMFDKDCPASDPLVYSETEGIGFEYDFHDWIRQFSEEDSNVAGARKFDNMEYAARHVESQLVLENTRLSHFLEDYAIEAKHWFMDDANSSLEEEKIQDESSSKPLTSTRQESDSEDDDSIEYEDFGVRSILAESDRKRKRASYCSSSSSEVEWTE